jgi:hypothetical protein
MRTASIILAALLLLVCNGGSGERLDSGARDISGDPRAQAIRAILDGTARDQLGDDVLGVIIASNWIDLVPASDRPAAFIVWFRFAPGDERIGVSYVSFPEQEEYGGQFIEGQPDRRLVEALARIAGDGGVSGLQNVKRLRVLTPDALKDGAALDGIFRKVGKKLRSRPIWCTLHYWGFKTKDRELIPRSSYYSEEYAAATEEGILDYIMGAVSHYDTPDEWKVKYIEFWKGWAYPPEYELQDDRISDYDPRFGLLLRVKK